MVHYGDNHIGLCTNKTPSFLPFLFYPSLPKSGNLLKLDQGRNMGNKKHYILPRKGG